jgi:hypothetical protein
MRSKSLSVLIVAILLLSALFTALPLSASAAPVVSSSIRIDGEADLATEADTNGWPGDGTASSPYVIANLSIDHPAKGVGIFIGNTPPT